jgi:hypothetical protein
MLAYTLLSASNPCLIVMALRVCVLCCLVCRFKTLYHGEKVTTKGSESRQSHANPVTVR